MSRLWTRERISKLWWAKDTHWEMQFRDIKNLMQSGFDKIYAENWLDKLDVERSFYECLNEVAD